MATTTSPDLLAVSVGDEHSRTQPTTHMVLRLSIVCRVNASGHCQVPVIEVAPASAALAVSWRRGHDIDRPEDAHGLSSQPWVNGRHTATEASAGTHSVDIWDKAKPTEVTTVSDRAEIGRRTTLIGP